MRYLDCPEGSFPWKIRQLLEDNSTAIDPAVVQTWRDLIGDSPPCLSREIHRAAFAILWMGLRGEREGLPSMLAISFAEAAGVAGRQKWGLVLSSSARVSQVTYQTVVGVRYPELVTFIIFSLTLRCPMKKWNVRKIPFPRPIAGCHENTVLLKGFSLTMSQSCAFEFCHFAAFLFQSFVPPTAMNDLSMTMDDFFRNNLQNGT